MDFKSETGKDCENIYLGKNQINALKQWIYKNCNEDQKLRFSMDREEYAGRKIYTVDCDDHLAVA